ncbi:MAG: glycosyltransferase [bacterium]|nr:glycosyltransferase [bacterium]
MPDPFPEKKIAIVCDWLTNMGGAEKVILSLHRLFPKAPIYTTLYDAKRVQGFENATIYTSFLQRIPFAQKKHPLFLNAMPMAVESFDLNEYDIVISSSHSVAKGIITKPETLHICYCHTPMRYAWEPWELEFRLKSFPSFMHNSIKKKMHKLRLWDRLTADRVDHFIANSSYVVDRIKKYYRRDATVINPPVNTDQFSIGEPKDYFLMVGRMIPYKRFDLVIETFNKLEKKLHIVGSGPDESRLKKLAGETITFLGRLDDEALRKEYRECKALIFPQLEDFGITPVECMASGRPVIAYAEGGANDSVVEGKTGLFFSSQSVESLSEALEQFEKQSWDPNAIKQHAEKFSEERFWGEVTDFITSKL